jgi:hypothetical protein
MQKKEEMGRQTADLKELSVHGHWQQKRGKNFPVGTM